MRVKISLKCSECGKKNYYTDKNKTAKEKLSFRRYCPKCNKHTVHSETKL
ncbi:MULTISPECIES: 50S ribosomal protein L33 [Pseudothermotoga]|uniref:Large ribosomal subunit protein bL33 n=1 Tax=Pseudothermotoga lettingae (strain ATCC BAA-301 / DSM 14385 / NBRC 107922 / TMO) TaxID=416591 RepID=RL33_PSELT|nr:MULTISPECIES: 50S ribosomal protein L33 [Pseudothermotoga]A8F4F3.1 RecName: Full=Large ribosomal subunit protein bL33; AltName: Full=50S ribosomal protein L33 [Pseudothermotoga lettingae TMO]ABV33037.1 ribosomal protein L33 [Pseudothermotoga lettingae TMO]GLI47961.1 50S ribosomal protein L33 [Pseudothermotoga lettingae TMO]HBJ80642.1 50S ribosomal protein L33 [Pseudothermotoga sp.]